MTSLPRAAYSDPDWHRREREELFAHSWVFAGSKGDFDAPGHFVTIRAGAFPLVVVKDRDGRLAAHHNVCRHRGTLLVEGASGNAGRSLVCPYHRWTYGLDGSLRGAPNLAACFPALDRSGLGLKPASLGVFKDLVFVNPDPIADFDSWIAPIRARAWPHDLTSKELREGAPLVYELKCDWKVFIENALDGYHLAYLHEKTLGGPVPGQNLWERHGDHMAWYAVDDEDARHPLPKKVRAEAKGSPRVKHAEGFDYAGVYFLFPSTLVVPTPFGVSVSSLVAIALGRCRIEVRNWVGPWKPIDERKDIPGFDETTGVISSDHWTTHPLETGDFQTEDVWICERVQAGLQSPAYDSGPLAQGAGAEDAVGWFRDTLLRSLNLAESI